MVVLVTILHVLVGLALILIVLLQSGKGAGIGAAFGGSSQTVFGGRGAGNFLTKATSAAAIIFMITSMTLAWHSSRSRSVVEASAAAATPAVTAQQSADTATAADDASTTHPAQADTATSGGTAAVPAQ